MLLACLLTACSLGGGSTGTVSTTTSGNTPATSHATSIPAQPTSAPAAHLTTYSGNGFTIGYPAGWTIEKASPSAASVIFVDPTRTIEFIVTVTPNPNANSATSVALDPLLQSMQAKPHYQKVDLHWSDVMIALFSSAPLRMEGLRATTLLHLVSSLGMGFSTAAVTSSMEASSST